MIKITREVGDHFHETLNPTIKPVIPIKHHTTPPSSEFHHPTVGFQSIDQLTSNLAATIKSTKNPEKEVQKEGKKNMFTDNC